MSPDLNAPGWVQVAGEWRWTGAGAPPGGVAAWEIAHEDYCGYPDDCRCLKVRPHADARTTERYIKETVAGADERRKQPPVDDDLDALRSRLAERPSALSSDACESCGHRRTVHDTMTPPGGQCHSTRQGKCLCRAWIAPDGYFLHLLDEPTYIRVEREKPSLWRRWRTRHNDHGPVE